MTHLHHSHTFNKRLKFSTLVIQINQFVYSHIITNAPLAPTLHLHHNTLRISNMFCLFCFFVFFSNSKLNFYTAMFLIFNIFYKSGGRCFQNTLEVSTTPAVPVNVLQQLTAATADIPPMAHINRRKDKNKQILRAVFFPYFFL